MPNNINALPSTGAISIGDIANAFYLYKSYSDGLSAAIDSYYGDLIKYYDPSTPPIPVRANATINIDPFHGKRYAFPVPLTASGNNYNVFDQANNYTIANYGYKLNTPGIPFNITITNKGNIGSTSFASPSISQGAVSYTTPGTYSWTVPTGVTSVNIVVVGGGGGGGYGGLLNLNGGGGGGGQVITANNVSVTPGQVISISVGSFGVGSTNPVGAGQNGAAGSASSFGSSYVAAGGGGGTGEFSGGAGGLAGGTGGTGGGSGASGGAGGTTLASPYGVGGHGGVAGSVSGKNGANGTVYITYAVSGGITTNTQGTAAMVIGPSSDGSKTFNSNTLVFLYNSGTITGATNTTPARRYPPGMSFVVNENQTSVSYALAGGGGGGHTGGNADNNGPSSGGNGGTGASTKGSISVTQGDVITFSIGGGGAADVNGGASKICKNSVLYASAAGGGAGGTRGATGTSYSGGGAGGTGGSYTDGGHSNGAAGSGRPGSATVSYIPNLPGGPALYVTKPMYLINTGTINGGTSSSGARNAGNAIIGVNNVTFTQAGYIAGGQIAL